MTGDLPLRVVEVVLPPDVAVDRVLVRPRAAPAFGRVEFEAPAGESPRVRFRVPHGPFVVLLRSDSRWAELGGDGDGDLDVAAPTFEEGVTFEGRVDGPLVGAVVRFFRLMGDEAVLGEGFSLRVSQSATYRGRLPTGTYLVETARRVGN